LHARRLESPVEVVAVEGDIDHPERYELAALDVVQGAAQALREVDAPRADADERQALGLPVPLDYLVRDPGERPLNGLPVHHLAGAVGAHGRRLRSPAGAGAEKKPPRPGRGGVFPAPAWSAPD